MSYIVGDHCHAPSIYVTSTEVTHSWIIILVFSLSTLSTVHHFNLRVAPLFGIVRLHTRFLSGRLR